MQSLLYGLLTVTLLGKGEEQSVKVIEPVKDDFENLDLPEDQFHQILNQVHKKIKLLDEFKTYIEKTKSNTVYYKYIVNTTIHEYNNNYPDVYKVLPGIFGNLYEYRISENLDDYFKTLAFLEL